MQALIAEAFAAYADPHIILNAVITPDPSYDIYHSSNYKQIFGIDGFDLVEVDTIMLPQVLPENTFVRGSVMTRHSSGNQRMKLSR